MPIKILILCRNDSGFSQFSILNYLKIAYSEVRNTYNEVRYIDITNYGYNEANLPVP